MDLLLISIVLGCWYAALFHRLDHSNIDDTSAIHLGKLLAGRLHP